MGTARWATCCALLAPLVLPVVRPLLQQISTSHPTLHLGTQENRGWCTVRVYEAEEGFGGVAGRERHSCTPKRRMAGGDRSPTGGVAGSATMGSGVGCFPRRVGQGFRVGWGVVGGLV